jgi:hypothetical protein
MVEGYRTKTVKNHCSRLINIRIVHEVLVVIPQTGPLHEHQWRNSNGDRVDKVYGPPSVILPKSIAKKYCTSKLVSFWNPVREGAKAGAPHRYFV